MLSPQTSTFWVDPTLEWLVVPLVVSLALAWAIAPYVILALQGL